MFYLLLILFLLILRYSEASGGANLTFPTEFKRLKDEPFGGVRKNSNKVFLKNRLLDNLNTFFNDKSESLEMLDSKSSFEDDVQMKVKPTDLPPMKYGFGRSNAKVFQATTTVAPVTASEAVTQKAVEEQVIKKRSEGKMTDSEMDTIREWRKRLYKAFKGKELKEPKRRVKKPEPDPEPVIVDKVEEVSKTDNEFLQFNDVTPLLVDKNRQVILSRKSPNWSLKGIKQSESFGRDSTGKIVPFGTEPSGYKHQKLILGAPSQVPRSYFAPNDPREIRQTTFRTSSQQHMAFVPAAGPNTQFQGQNPVLNSFPAPSPFQGINPYPPPSQTLYPPPRLPAFPTGPAPRMPDYNLPAMPTAPQYPAGPAPRLPDYQPLPQLPHYEIATATAPPQYLPMPTTPIQLLSVYNTPQPPQIQYNKYPDQIVPFQPSAVYQPSFSTQWPETTQPTTTEAPVDENEMEDETEMFGPPIASNNDCSENGQNGGSCDVMISDEKCNSNRLRTIIQNNIVSNDAEASKRAVQLAAEEETGSYFNAICGTGFFSYIAHTDEFCLASSMGVNCYVFSPVCSYDTQNNFFARKRRKNRSRKRLVNKN